MGGPAGRILAMRNAFLLLLVLAACSKFQTGFREMRNDEWEGKQSPPIAGGTWLASGDVGEQQFGAAEYRVLAFFSPT